MLVCGTILSKLLCYAASISFVRTGKTDPTKKDLRKRERQEQEKEMQEYMDKHVVDIHKEKRDRAKLTKENKFEQLRKLPTERQYREGMENWQKGIHYPYDWDKGIPFVIVEHKGRAGALVHRDLNFETFIPKEEFKSDAFTENERLNEIAYFNYMSSHYYAKAEKYLKEFRIQEEIEQKRLAEEKEAVERQRRRIGPWCLGHIGCRGGGQGGEDQEGQQVSQANRR